MNKTLTALFAATIYLVSPIADAATYYFHNDHLGTPQALSDVSQNIVWRGEYEPIGSVTESVNSVEQNLRFPGQYYDQESGLHYNYFRDYDPSIGRYVQSDPIGLLGGLNTYAFVGSNPLMYVDPLGLDAQVTVWQPVGWGSSSFGHTSISSNGTTWSWGPNGMTTMSQADYNSRNSFRSGATYNIPLTPQLDAVLADFLSNYDGDYNSITNNCTAPIQQGLQQTGVNIGNNILPVSLGNAILNSGVANGFSFQTPSQPATGSSAPWAK